MESILTSTKKLSGIDASYEHFDADIVMYINSVFLNLKQLGVGPAEGFIIKDEDATWTDFIPDNEILRESTKAYMGAKVRLRFDPPSSSVLMTALTETIKEYEWRLNVDVETP